MTPRFYIHNHDASGVTEGINSILCLWVSSCTIKLGILQLLPFQHENVKMPDNHHQTVQHAVSMRKCFKDQQFYDDNIEEGKLWYSPHHGIYHSKKLDKIWVVLTVAVRTKVCILIKNSCRVQT